MIKSQSDLYGNVSNAFIVSSDGIGLPVFGPSGMENWGLIKYRETGVLVKEGETSSSSREGIARLVAHEVAHLVKPVLSVLQNKLWSCNPNITNTHLGDSRRKSST